jgi:hypothetical protein
MQDITYVKQNISFWVCQLNAYCRRSFGNLVFEILKLPLGQCFHFQKTSFPSNRSKFLYF